MNEESKIEHKNFLQRHVTAIDIGAGIVIVFLTMAAVFFALQSVSYQEELASLKNTIQAQHTNDKVLNFTKLFIEKVLRAQGEIDFETRLKLEGAVRDIEDAEILKAWQDFTASTSEQEAQERVKVLLSVLVNKIK